jgi:peptide-methionine (S)-S-oxide reductase
MTKTAAANHFCSPMTEDTEEIYLAGGCLWGVQEFVRHLPGVVATEAGRANGSSHDTSSEYDGYAECVRTRFDPSQVTVKQLMTYFFEIIDPYSVDRQGPDRGRKYRTGVYSEHPKHLARVRDYIAQRADAADVRVEVKPLTNYVRSDETHQDRLSKHPEDTCHLPVELLHKYK